MRIITDGTLFEATGEEKVQARAAGIMCDMFKDMKMDDVVGRDGLLTNGTAAIKGPKMTAGTGRGIFIKAGIGVVGGILLAADEVSAVVVIRFEGRTKIQNNAMLVKVENINSNERNEFYKIENYEDAT